MTGSEIIAKLNELGISGNDLYEYLVDSGSEQITEEKAKLIEDTFGTISQEWISQDETDDIVVGFDDHNVLIGVSASWDDFREEWNGYEDDFAEVEKVASFRYIPKK